MEIKHKVLLPQRIEEEASNYLENNGCELIFCSRCERGEVIEKVKDAEAIVLRTGIFIDEGIIRSGRVLKTISRTGAGIDNVDINAATEAGVVVTSSLGANTSSVIEHALSMILCISKKLITLDREVRNGNFGIRYKNISSDIAGKTLGIVGVGRIGSGLASICRALGMKIIAFDEYLPEKVKKELDGIDFTSLDELLCNSDYISLHIPLTEDTREIIDFDKFQKMKSTAVIINTSRGGVISERDLIKALSYGIIAYAGLDVFEKEPIEAGNKLLELENVLLTPHTAALTKECTVRMAVESAKRVVDFFSGKLPENVANPEVLQNISS